VTPRETVRRIRATEERNCLTAIKRSPTAVGILVVLVVAAIGASLALQGWKSRIPIHDSLPVIDSAQNLLVDKQIPVWGNLASFAAHNPPGGAWLMIPGVFVFTDPRLFASIGSVTIYLGTLIGILLLARTCFGMPCAILSVSLYGLSELGLYVAESLWDRLPLHFFYIWMVYWTVQWVKEKQAKYLAAAIVSWAAGMYVFMEIAPALFILPTVWFFYRPPVRIRPLLFAGIFSLAIWYPYLKIESAQSFANLRSLVLRQGNFPANYKDSWCDPGLTMVNLENAALPGPIKVDETLNVTDSIWTKVSSHLLPLWKRGNFAVVASSSNFRRATPIPGMSIVLTILCVISLFVLSVSGTSFAAAENDRRWRYWLPRFAAGMIVVGVLWNEFFVARYLSLNGFLEATTISSIRWLQVIFVLGGITLIMSRSRIAPIVNRLAIPSGVGIQNTPHPENARLLVLSLLLPWSILVFMVEDTSRMERFWWLWPIQVVVLAAFVTYIIPSRLQAPRVVSRIGSALLIFVLVGNSFLLSRVVAWNKAGWAGADPHEVQAVDFVVSRLEGRNQAAIGYQLFIGFFMYMARFNAVDPRYKVGAEFDVLFKARHVPNTNRCAEGVSPDDEFRIVRNKLDPGPENPRYLWYFDLPLDNNFHLLRQFGPYQVFQRN